MNPLIDDDNESEVSPRNAAEREKTLTPRKRIPMTGRRLKLDFGDVAKNDPAHHYHGFNDEDNRLQDALNAGYEFVSANEVEQSEDRTGLISGDINATRVRRLVGTRKDCDALFMYLMRIPIQFFEEDQAELEARNSMVDDQIRRGTLQSVENMHLGSQGRDISYKNSSLRG